MVSYPGYYVPETQSPLQGLFDGLEQRKKRMDGESAFEAGMNAATGAPVAPKPAAAPFSLAALGNLFTGGNKPQTAVGAIDAAAPQSGGGTPIGGKRQSFIDMMMPSAIEAGKRTGVDPRIIVAQAAQETGWGRSAPGNNYFGIKSHGQGGGQQLNTHEYVDGKRVNVADNFRAFGSPEESVNGYADFLMQNPRYKPMMGAQGMDAQLEALQASGYATDPNYSRSVGAIARGIPMSDAPAGAPQGASPQSRELPSREVLMTMFRSEAMRPMAIEMVKAAQEGRTAEPVVINGQLVDPYTREVLGDYRTQETVAPDKPISVPAGNTLYDPNSNAPIFTAPQAPPDAKESFGNEKDLYAQYSSAAPVKSYQAVRDGFERVRTSALTDSGAGDLGVVYGFMKMLDPGSVVREGEFATAEQTAGVPQQVVGLYNRIISGERLTPEQRTQFITAAQGLYSDTAGNLSDTNTQFSSRAEAWGVDPSRFIMAPESYDTPAAAPVDYKAKYGLQ